MVERFQEDPEVLEEANQESGFNPTWEYVKHVVKTTAITALKAAVIGGIVLGALALIPAAPLGLIGTAVEFLSFGLISPGLGTATLIGGASWGAMLGGVAGLALGLAKGFGGAEEAVEDAQNALVTKAARARQLAANQEMMEMNMARLRGGSAAGMGIAQQNQLPMGVDQGRGMMYT